MKPSTGSRNRESGWFGFRYELVLGVFLLGAAGLFWRNADLEIPEALYALGAFLALSLWEHRQLVARRFPRLVPSSVAFRVLAVSGLVYWSGGDRSVLWVLYLVPIVHSAMLSSPGTTWRVVFLSMACGVLAAWRRPWEWGGDQVFKFAVEGGLFVWSAAVVGRQARAEREEHLRALEAERIKEENERQLEMVRADLLRAERVAAVGEVANGVAHDLNNALGAVYGYAQLLARGLSTDDPRWEDVERLREATRKCSAVGTRLLEFSRVERFALRPGRVETAVETAVELGVHTFRAASVEVVTQLEEDLPSVMYSTPHLQQAVWHMLNWAKDRAVPGGVVFLRLVKVADGVEVRVEDSGPALSREEAISVLSPHLDVRPPLGLSVCLDLIQRHGGTLRVQPRNSHGAAVVARLPVVVEPGVAGERAGWSGGDKDRVFQGEPGEPVHVVERRR